ncbi:MAG: phage virion morphogenesis protein [Prevotella sp.]|nr:phage virion morphogenesis protein [Prevotella sp.]
MRQDDLTRRISALKREIDCEVRDRLPRKVAIVAKNHFTQNFRDGGFTNGGLHPWQRTRRQQQGGPDSQYGPLTSRRNHLMRSIQTTTAPGRVTVENPVPYAAIHNDGGDVTTHPTVTARMRRFAWHMVYSLSGRSKGEPQGELPPEAQKWKALALTKKTRLTINAHIPQRQFIGDSRELIEKISSIFAETMERIKKLIT